MDSFVLFLSYYIDIILFNLIYDLLFIPKMSWKFFLGPLCDFKLSVRLPCSYSQCLYWAQLHKRIYKIWWWWFPSTRNNMCVSDSLSKELQRSRPNLLRFSPEFNGNVDTAMLNVNEESSVLSNREINFRLILTRCNFIY